MSELHQSLAEGLAGGCAPRQPEWLAALRGHAGEMFRTNGLPGHGVERWKYTSLRRLERLSPRLGRSGGAAGGTVVCPPLRAGTPRVAMVNGDWSLLDGPVPDSMLVMPLHAALAEDHESLRNMVESLDIRGPANGFAALNTAVLGAGVFIRVPRGTDGGSLLLQWLGAGSDGAALFNSRVCIVLEEGARLELLEQHENDSDSAPLLNLVTQVRTGRGARLEHVRVQREATAACLVSRTEVRQLADSHYRHTALDLGGGLVRHDIGVDLSESGAACEIHGGCLAGGRSHVDHHVDVIHTAPGCTSNQLFRGVLDGRSRVVFNGRVHVAEGADGTDAQQSSKGLLLSPHAEMDAKPELEIYADEVMASHGATVGQLDEDAMFYLRSRGVDAAMARRLLTLAFCRAVVDRVANDETRKALAERLEAVLAAGGIAR